MRYSLVLVLVLLVAVAPSFGQPSAGVGSRAPDFDLKDQFGKTWSLSGLNGNVTILIVADSNSGRAMGPWVEMLKSRYASKAQVLGLLDLHTVPGIGRGIARSRIKRETKEPMMLDFGGSVAKTYGVSSKVPTVVVIDRSGIVRAVARTTFDQAAFAPIAAAVDKSLK